MRVKSGGNVGIGITSPNQKFVVADANSVTNSFGNAFIFTSDAAADKGGYITLGGAYTGTTTTPFAGIAGRFTSGTSGYMALTTLNSGTMVEQVRVTATGNLGIGTTIPTTANGITGIGGRILNLSNTGNRSFLNIEGTYADISLISSAGAANQKWMILRNSSGSTHFITHNDAGATVLTPFTILHSNGNIGIGPPPPGYKLEVNGTFL